MKQALQQIKNTTITSINPAKLSRADTKQKLINMIDDLDNEIRILENRHDETDRAECSIGLVASS